MDKWKESELAKMKAGGNRKARIFLDAQDDWNDSSPISQKYQSRACALLKDKIMVESQGKFKLPKNTFHTTFQNLKLFIYKMMSI